jgi:nucleoredoxin
MEALFGDTLRRGKESVPTKEALGDAEVILLQFSAEWCGPCQMFTPLLIEFYKSFEKKGQKAPAVVFVSSDRDEASFEKYFEEMPWLALPYTNREAKAKLSSKFKVRGIPTVIALDAATGKVISTNVREGVMSAPEDYPWRPKTFDQVMEGVTLVGCGGDAGKTLDVKERLEGKFVALYFSAHWCPPCKMFTPMFGKTYEAIRKTRDDFEVVFVSSDRDAGSFDGYIKEQPWTAISYADEKVRAELGSMFEVQGIPSLVLLDANRKVVNANARASAMRDQEGKEFPWLPKPVSSLEEGAEFLNESACLVVLQEAAPASDAAAVLDALNVVAEAEKAAAGDDDDDQIHFMVATENDGVTDQIRQLTSLGKPEAGNKRTICGDDVCSQVDGTTPVAVLLNIPDGGGYYVLEDLVTENSLKKFIADFKAGSLERQQMSK